MADDEELASAPGGASVVKHEPSTALTFTFTKHTAASPLDAVGSDAVEEKEQPKKKKRSLDL